MMLRVIVIPVIVCNAQELPEKMILEGCYLFCKQCGKQLPDGSRFCSDCGQDQFEIAAGTLQQSSTQPYVPYAPQQSGVPLYSPYASQQKGNIPYVQQNVLRQQDDLRPHRQYTPENAPPPSWIGKQAVDSKIEHSHQKRAPRAVFIIGVGVFMAALLIFFGIYLFSPKMDATEVIGSWNGVFTLTGYSGDISKKNVAKDISGSQLPVTPGNIA